MSRITVVDAGFGALTAIRKLRAGDPGVQIDVVAPRPEFVYYPGTIWIPNRLTWRTCRPALLLPLHWVKRYFEWMYLRKYR